MPIQRHLLGLSDGSDGSCRRSERRDTRGMTEPSSLITTPFGAESTAAEVIDGIDLTGKRAIVTGASSGIGVETARALAGAGAEVTLAVRDVDAGRRVAAALSATNGRPVRIARLDLQDLASVAGFVAGWTGALHILINNAGVMAVRQRELTA